MPGLDTPTAIIPITGWPRGLNREAFELQVNLDETPDAVNVVFGLRGEVERRDGWTRWDSGTETVAQLAVAYEPGSGTDKIIVVEEDGGVWDGTTSVLTAATVELGAHSNRRNWQITAAMLDDDLYIFTLRDNTWRWDGSAWLEITDSTLNEGGTHAVPEAPKAATAVAHNNRIYAGNTVHDGAAQRSRINFSNPSVVSGVAAGDAGGDRWGALDWIDINPDDGTEVTKLASFQSNLIAFKDHSVHVVTGTDQDSHTVYQVADDVGCSSPQSVAQYEGSMFFFDRFRGVFHFDGNNVQRIDHAIHSYLMNGQNLNKAWRARGFFSDSRYFLSVPWGSDSYNSRMFVFDTRIQAWAEYDYGVYDHVWWNEKQYTVGNGNNVGVYKHEQGDSTDIAAAISWYIETAWFPNTGAQGMTRHRLRRADVWVEADSSSFTAAMFVDGVESAVWTHTQTADTNRIRLPGYGALFETAKFKFSGT